MRSAVRKLTEILGCAAALQGQITLSALRFAPAHAGRHTPHA